MTEQKVFHKLEFNDLELDGNNADVLVFVIPKGEPFDIWTAHRFFEMSEKLNEERIEAMMAGE